MCNRREADLSSTVLDPRPQKVQRLGFEGEATETSQQRQPPPSTLDTPASGHVSAMCNPREAMDDTAAELAHRPTKIQKTVTLPEVGNARVPFLHPSSILARKFPGAVKRDSSGKEGKSNASSSNVRT